MTDTTREWLEADGLGGFASGTASGIRTRRYHGALLVATTPPTGRVLLVNGYDAWVESDAGTFFLSSQKYLPDVVHPDGARRIEGFSADPWPTWTIRLDDGTRIQHELFVRNGAAVSALSWRLLTPRDGIKLFVRPFFSGRDYHSLHHENPAFAFEPARHAGRLIWDPYPGIPAIVSLSNGEYLHRPDWYRNFLYEEEKSRGLDFAEDLASPGLFGWDISRQEAVWILFADGYENGSVPEGEAAMRCIESLREAERKRRKGFLSVLQRAGDAYLVRRGAGKTIAAGYPWFTDWGRDTFISVRGLCLATGKLDEARQILVEWAGAVSEGMLPNRFPDRGETPEYNSVDASLWYVIAVHEFLSLANQRMIQVLPHERDGLQAAVGEVLSGFLRGTRYGIRAGEDGLLACGEPGVQLTWMDAKVGNRVVTPRTGKPVEVQALWLNGLWIGSQWSQAWQEPYARGRESFRKRFWNEERKCLYDVVDADHIEGALDASLRPNQIFAVGGLPIAVLDGTRAAAVVDAVERHLWTPLGLRSLAPGEPGYIPRYEGGVPERDGAYHQGTVWPWLLGSFVEAWVRVRGGTQAAKQQARQRFFEPLLQHLDEAGLGHISEIADAEPPHAPKGCPFQAWSVGEALRIDLVVLASKKSRFTERARSFYETGSAT